ncbi:MAG TPA: penicillin-binding protein 2 [Solirubrobacterales bacterium]|nr:penicillin-binding protein 2 [Solirubrobacterales bacterium]
MFDSQWRRRAPSPAQLQLRVAVLAGFALVLFTVIFFRLWYLEVLSGDKYLAQAENNQVREFTVQAPRGIITDRDGEELVTNRTALELQVKADELPENLEARRRLFDRLAPLTRKSPAEIRKSIREQLKELPSSPATIQRDVPYETVYYLRENQDRFPGVSVERVYVRQYPQGDLAAHLLGYVREVDQEELEDPRFETLQPGDYVGKDGVELAYDSVLRGINGATRVQVDASGNPSGRTLTERDPRQGNDLVLSLDADVQRAGQSAVGAFGYGGFVAMNVKNGEIVGLGSSPSYNPSALSKPEVSEAAARSIFGDPEVPTSSLAAPAVNRATQAAYPTGSTFKPITALAALDSGNLGINEIINDTGEYDPGDGNILRNAGDAVNGPIDLRDALRVSSDVFFYILGARTNVNEGDGGPLQEWARALGFGEPTGIDVGSEGDSLVPDPDWRQELYEYSQDPDSPGGEEVVPDDVYEWGGADRPWSVGDNINLAIGQGDLQANPLQMAVAYAAIANGGDIVRPHVGLRVEDPQGRVVQEVEPAPRRHVEIEESWRQAIMEGLREAAMEPTGTSYNVFGGYPEEIAGKTGTAERPPHGDQSWYVAIAPYDDPKYVVAVTIEQGGFGADTAAPAARTILNELLDVNEAKIEQVQADPAVYE